jgi:hypothetical protein
MRVSLASTAGLSSSKNSKGTPIKGCPYYTEEEIVSIYLNSERNINSINILTELTFLTDVEIFLILNKHGYGFEGKDYTNKKGYSIRTDK